MSDNTVKGQKKLTSPNNLQNAIDMMVRQIIADMVETGEIVRIDSSDQNGSSGTGGYASGTPLICMTDGYGNAISSTQIPEMKVYRPQAGKAAVILDPQPGDKGIAVFTKRDSSGIGVGTSEPLQPASFRSFDQADGVLFTGILGETPEIWLHLDPVSGDISLSTKTANIDISCRDQGDIVIKTGSGNITIQAGNGGEGTITLDGKVIVTRNIVVQNKNSEGQSQMTGGFSNTGNTIESNGIVLEQHVHSGVDSGPDNTGPPL
jgi:hypothetical protein